MIVYKTTNLINNKIYVGQDSHNDPKYFGSGKFIQRAIKKYGKENFKKEIIEECQTFEQLNEREIFWIKELNSRDINIGYNICEGGLGGKGNSGYKHTKEAKRRIGESSKNRNTGKKHSKEQNDKISKKLTGRKQTQEHIEHSRKSNTGKKRSQETKDNISRALMGNKNSVGHKPSEEARAKMRLKRRARTKPKVTKVCLNCNKEFIVSYAGRCRKFCSVQCNGKYHSGSNNPCKKKGIFKHCLICGEEFYAGKLAVRKYCSNKCAGKGRVGDNNPARKPGVGEKISKSKMKHIVSNEKIKNCLNCNSEMIIKVNNRKYYSRNRKYCSRKCYLEYINLKN